VVTPFKYSIGLDNMVDSELIGIVSTNIQSGPHLSLRLAAEKNCHRGTEAQKVIRKGFLN